jgi:hypothetical protein
MTATHRLAAILAADVGVREHRGGTPKTAPTTASLESSHQRNHASGLARSGRAYEGRQRASFRLA